MASKRFYHKNDDDSQNSGPNIEMATSIAEIYQDNEEFELLAMHYHNIDNKELRDKYIEMAIEKNPSEQAICFLRGLQDRPDLIPPEVIDREMERYTKNKDWSQRARFQKAIGRKIDAVSDYINGINVDIKNNKIFAAAYYLKELVEEGLIDELFVEAFKKAKNQKDLWWQVRSLQELGWQKELKTFIVENADEIRSSNNSLLMELLAQAENDEKKLIELRKERARFTRISKQ